MQVITINRRRRWHLFTHIRVGLRNRLRSVFAYVGLATCLAFLLWHMAGRPGL